MTHIDAKHKVKTLRFNKLTTLYKQQEKHPFVYRINQGFIIVYTNNINGKSGLTDLLGQGNWVGPGLTDGIAIQNASVKPGSVLERIQQTNFEELINNDTQLARFLIQQLSQREQTLQQRLFLQQTASLAVRLARLLLHLFNHQGQSCTHNHERHVKLSQQELADMIGSSRQSVNQLLSEWKQQALIDYTRSYICLENINKFKTLYPE